MKDQLISIETSKMLDEVGFNIPTIYYYNEKGEIDSEYDWIPSFGGLQAPTQSLLQRWLRERKVLVEVVPVDSWDNWSFSISIEDCMAPFAHVKMDDIYEFKTYEEALEKGLQDALKLIK